MTDIKIDMSGHIELIRNFSGAQDVIREEMTTLVRDAALGGSNIAKDLVGKRTHHLERSITPTQPVWAGGTVTAAWGTNVPYARAHEEGTDPHIITPKKAKVLRFTVGNKTVFARRVRHPGTKPRLYMKGSYERVRDRMPYNADTMKLRIIQRLAGGGG